jgi:hypothetical protein
MICTGPNPSHQHRICALNRAASRYQHLFQLTLVKRIMLWPTLPDDAASDNFKLRSLIILRTLMRSDAITASLATSKPSLALIFELFERTAREQAHLPECEQLVNLTRIVLRLAQNAQTLPVFAELSHAGHPNVEMLLFLLTTKNYHVLQSCLRALLQLAQSDDTVALLSRHLQEQSLHHILDIIKECYNPPPPPPHPLPPLSQPLAAASPTTASTPSSCCTRWPWTSAREWRARRRGARYNRGTWHPPPSKLFTLRSPTTQAVQRTRALLLQQGANRVLVNVLELFADGQELDEDETEIAVELL